MADPGARETKLIQYLNEAYGKEKELETALQAHIKMAGARARLSSVAPWVVTLASSRRPGGSVRSAAASSRR